MTVFYVPILRGLLSTIFHCIGCRPVCIGMYPSATWEMLPYVLGSHLSHFSCLLSLCCSQSLWFNHTWHLPEGLNGLQIALAHVGCTIIVALVISTKESKLVCLFLVPSFSCALGDFLISQTFLPAFVLCCLLYLSLIGSQ